ncbi:FK506-binding protein 1 [Phytophthora nicotianae]|uniref:FK506-binding protein 1 n=1 Tax=Phytophthora nicotianae TaxID=4792 RepID=A0A0W8CYU4_PHYNI|nr:FK506-binding protein 1 [Phytophthora nicotianae]
MAFFTSEDLKISFNFFCTVYGIGTLGLPSNFARSGITLAVIALLFMGFANICSCVAISRVMLAAPKTVKTYGDVGEWCCGKIGRYLVLFVQFGVCCLVPTAFLVLGGILLDGISPDAFDQQYWSIIMAAMLMPVILTPTLKEGAAAAFAGCLGTLLADAIALGVLAHGIGSDHRPSSPRLRFRPGCQLVWQPGAGLLRRRAGAALQREHSQPERMPRVVATTMAFTACLFLIIGVTAYSFVGCQIPGNLLFAIGGTALDLNANRGAVVLAYMFMQLHITIAMSWPLVTAKYMTLRVVIVVILLIIAIIFKDHFVDFTDFVGAWAVSMACIILPIFFYLKVFWNRTPWYEKAIGAFIIVVCAGLGGYVTYTTGKNLFLDIVSDKTFQYCPAGYDMVVYTNETFYGNN